MLFKGTMYLLAGYLAGVDMAAIREVIKKMFGIDTDPLAPYYEITEPITFTLPPVLGGDKDLGLGTTFYIPLKGTTMIWGQYTWSAIKFGDPCTFGPPVCVGPLNLFDMGSNIFPGPPMYGWFSFP
jgi:hypothetical protein